MNCKRSAVVAVALGDRLSVFGGFDGISSLDTVERFNPEETPGLLSIALLPEGFSCLERSTPWVVTMDCLYSTVSRCTILSADALQEVQT